MFKKNIFCFLIICNIIFAQNPVPRIESFSPQSGKNGSIVTITGNNFSTINEDVIVRFGNVKAKVLTADPSLLTVIAPIGITLAPISITIKNLSCISENNFEPRFIATKNISLQSYTSRSDYPITSSPVSVSMGDLDDNGTLDIVTSNFGSNNLNIYQNISLKKNIVFSKPVLLSTGNSPHHTIMVDIDGDGKLDLVTVNRGGNSISVFRNTTSGDSINASSFAPKNDFPTGALPMHVGFGDLNKDGKFDLVIVNSGSNTVSILKNISYPGTIQFSPKVDLITGGEPNYLIVKDINKDFRPEIIVANRASNTVSMFWNNTIDSVILISTFSSKIDIATAIGPMGFVFNDINLDGKVDLILSNHDNTTVSVFINTSVVSDTLTTSYTSKFDFSVGSNPWDLVLSDLNGDGKHDIVTTNWGSGTISILQNKISGDSINFGTKIDLLSGNSPRGLGIGDLDGNGVPDIAVTAMGSSMMGIYRNIIAEPIAPMNLSALNNKGDAALHWNKSENTAFLKYYIYSGKNLNEIIRVDSTSNGILDTLKNITGLQLGSRYYFFVTTIDSTGNESPFSNMASMFTNDEISPAAPKNLSIVDSINYKIKLNWNKNTEQDFIRYRIYKDVSINPTSKVDSTTNGRNDTSKILSVFQVNKRIYLRITAVDSLGNESDFGNEVNTSLIDIPNAPTNLKALAGNNQVKLLWNKNGEIHLRHYYIYGGTSMGSIKLIDSTQAGAADTTKIITALVNNIKYYFFIKAIDSIGNESNSSNLVSGTPNDGLPPSIPQNLVVLDSSGNTVKLKWMKNNDNDFLRYLVYIDTSLILKTKMDSTKDNINDTIKTISGLKSGVRYYFSVTAVDSFGHESGYSNVVTAQVDNKIPKLFTFSPLFGNAGTEITIIGKNYSQAKEDIIVRFGTVKANILHADSNSLTVISPAGATFSPIYVTVKNQTCISGNTFLPTFSGGGTISSSTFSSKSDYVIQSTPASVAFGDIDNNSLLDIVTANYGSSSINIYRNNSTTKNIILSQPIKINVGTSPHHVVCVDLNNDGRLDLVTVNRGAGTISLLKNIGVNDTISSSTFALKEDYPAGNLPMFAAASDLDNDGWIDLVVTNSGSNTISIFKNTSTMENIHFSPKIDFSVSSEPCYALIKDLNNDGKPDLLVSNLNSNTISLLWNKSAAGEITQGSFDPKIDINAGNGPLGIIINDFNNDGKNDLIVSNHHSNTISILKNTSSKVDTMISTAFAPAADFPAGTNPWDAALSDINGDGKPDFVTTNWNSSTISLFQNNSSQNVISLENKIDLPVGESPRGLGIGDLDGDGKPDLAVTSWSSSIMSIYRNISGEGLGVKSLTNSIPTTFSLAQNYPNPFNPSTVIRYGIPEHSYVQVDIYNIIGQKILTLVDAEQEPNFYEVTWNPTVASGIYYYRIRSVSVKNPNNIDVRQRTMNYIK